MSGMAPSRFWSMLTNNHERPCRDHAEPLAGVGVQDVVGPAQLGIDLQGQVVGVLPLLLGVQGAVCSHTARSQTAAAVEHEVQGAGSASKADSGGQETRAVGSGMHEPVLVPRQHAGARCSLEPDPVQASR